MERTIDLRSDTVTRPTEEMSEAMARAPVGDDVYGEDPTVNALEALAAQRVGKEASLFVASGTMGNLVALLTHCQRGDEVVVEAESHTYSLESGGMSALAGAIPHPIHGVRGHITAVQLESVLRPPNVHFAATRLVCLENTHNRAGGTVTPVPALRETCAAARGRGIAVHLDGARIFNAAVALGVDAREVAASVDSVMFCLSKGLSAPVGSMLCGSRAFIERARFYRKMVGGGMRQAGELAAAGIVALEKMVDRLAEDHRHARMLAEGIGAIPGLFVDMEAVHSNIVMVEVRAADLDAAGLVQRVERHGVRANRVSARKLRLVTHRHVAGGDVEEAVAVFRSAMATADASRH
ncbi:MAG: low-specificity L-threonine aldolase [Armatimonadetes bacterium]|nr:low-specificity L-threonine aldolase [Armatimonadota bacterium]